jgi:arabinofuranan 3-O-arabinosyltransferase
MPSRALNFLTARRTRVYLAWAALLVVVGHRCGQGWVNFRQADRPSGNDGYTSIDFGGQWLLGRLLVTGHGHELYSRAAHLEVARQAYPHAGEPPNRLPHDAEQLVDWYPGGPDDPVGGPLYPPVHAFVMAPLALIPDPYVAYRVTQGLMLGLTLFAGLGVRYGTNGRWWWTAAAAFLVAFPGCRGSISLAQNSSLTLTILIWGWALMVRGRPGWGAFLWGLLAFKPVWAISFLLALLVLRRWRSALVMAITGAALALATLPVVGVQVWFDWLHVGGEAAKIYATDHNWIFLSRDLFGIPRRMLLDFPDGQTGTDRPAAGFAGWALWLAVAGTTVLVVRTWCRRHGPPVPLTGPVGGLVLLAAWLCTYRFMYYDSLIAAVGVVAILADPAPFFRRRWWPFRSWVPALAAVLLIIENATAPLNVELTASIRGFRWTEKHPDGSTVLRAPTIHIASGDDYPWDTVTVLALWVWCAVQVLRARPAATEDRTRPRPFS